MKGSIVNGPISEKSYRYRTVLQNLGTVSPTASLQNARPYDATGTHESDLGSKQVHASTTASGTPKLSSEEFGDQRHRRETLGKRMAMSSVGAKDRIVGCQMSTHTRGDRLLAYIGVACPVDQTHLMASGKLLFGLPDDLHRAIQIENALTIDFGHRKDSKICFSVRRGSFALWCLDGPEYHRHSSLGFHRPSG